MLNSRVTSNQFISGQSKIDVAGLYIYTPTLFGNSFFRVDHLQEGVLRACRAPVKKMIRIENISPTILRPAKKRCVSTASQTDNVSQVLSILPYNDNSDPELDISTYTGDLDITIGPDIGYFDVGSFLN